MGFVMRKVLIVAAMACAVSASQMEIQAGTSPLIEAKNDVAKVIGVAAPCKGAAKIQRMQIVAFDRHSIALRSQDSMDGYVVDEVTYKADMRRLFVAKYYQAGKRPSNPTTHVVLNCRTPKCFNRFREGLRPHQTRSEKSSLNITLCSGKSGRPDPALTQRLSLALNNLIKVAK